MNRQRIWLGLAVVVVALVVVMVAAGQTRNAGATASCDSGTAVPNPADNSALVSDCETLLAAKDTLRGTATLNWSADRAITSWTGVTVAGTPQRVTKLVLESGTLNGTIPASLGDLSALTQLRLGWNQLTGTIPPGLGNLTRLTQLNLAGNRLSGAIPPELGSIGASLTHLVLSGPSPLPSGIGLTGSIPPELGYLSGLQSLYLDGNRLTGTIPTRLGRLTNLTWLLLTGNQLSGPIPTQLGDLTTLTHLELQDNNLSGAIPTQLGDLRTLRKAYLKRNSGLTGCVPRGLSDVRFNDAARLGLPTCAADAPSTPMTPLPTHTLTVTATGSGSVTPAGTSTHDEGSEVTLTAIWTDATHYFDSWGGACSGAVGAICTLSPFDDDATVSASFAERCTAGATDPTCIRVVYIGAPDDYANVADIPDNLTFTPTSEGRYQVGRGEQITVVTGGASLPEGWTRFYLQLQPLTANPSPLSYERLIPPVGTTYTFTPTTDPEGAVLITFDLTAAKPHPVRPSHKPILGAVVVTTQFEVVTCDSGIAVPDPDANTELVEDCKTLLVVKDTLAGTATLNWSAGRPITEWEGITVADSPKRVTKLELADSGLTGELSPSLGDLTALTELRLNDNELTGVIPGRYAQIDDLRFAYISNNSLEGCIPHTWNGTYATESSSRNDFAASGLEFCSIPVNAATAASSALEGGKRYKVQAQEDDAAVHLEIPEGRDFGLAIESAATDDPNAPPYTIAVVSGYSRLIIDPRTGEEFSRYVDTLEGSGTRSSHPLNAVFDEIIDSIWIEE